MLLGEARWPVSQLVSDITQGFPFHATTADQTTFLRRSLERLGKSLGYTVASPRSGGVMTESRLDLAWWEPGAGTILVADCEWGNAGEVAAAFTALMTVKAPMKLLIFRSRQAGGEREDVLLRSDTEAVLTAVGAALIDFNQHLEGEHYVLLERLDRQPEFRTYEFLVPAHGRLALGFGEAAHVFRGVVAAP